MEFKTGYYEERGNFHGLEIIFSSIILFILQLSFLYLQFHNNYIYLFFFVFDFDLKMLNLVENTQSRIYWICIQNFCSIFPLSVNITIIILSVRYIESTSTSFMSLLHIIFYEDFLLSNAIVRHLKYQSGNRFDLPSKHSCFT